jgi:predicted GH43/DUF377 family glycosyl hydrolase
MRIQLQIGESVADLEELSPFFASDVETIVLRFHDSCQGGAMRTFSMLIIIALMSMRCDMGSIPNSVLHFDQTGSVSLALAKTSIPSEVKLIVARLERQVFQTYSDSVSVVGVIDSVRFRFTGVPAGSWNVTVEARDVQGVTRYSGKATIAVTDGQVTAVLIQMTPISGGEVQITLVWGNPQIRWKMYAGNPILKQTPGYWDQDHYYFDAPAVVKVNGVYQMWYQSGLNRTISSGGNDAFWIAYATSSDGITWTKQGAVLNPGPAGSWMDIGPWGPSVLYENGVYKMWFVGAKYPLSYRNGIGYATSTDGKNWIMDAQPVVPLSATIGATLNPAVIKMGEVYDLFVGITSSTTDYSTDIILMTSSDGRAWTNKGVVMSARKDLPWQQSGILPCDVIYDEGKLKMFYTGFLGQTFSLGYAESSQGTSWDNSGVVPILTTSDTPPWTTKSVGFPAVMRDSDGKLKMWFSGISTQTSRYQIGYAEQLK